MWGEDFYHNSFHSHVLGCAEPIHRIRINYDKLDSVIVAHHALLKQ